MPSRKSNKNLMHLPPLPAPEGRRCITVAVPDDPQWIALFYGAIFRLSQQVWYDRDAAHSAKDVAAVWQQVYLETLNETGDCMDGCLCYLRRNPATGRYQYSTDGLDWFEVDDGPWIDAPVTPQWPPPTPREGTDTQRRCDAAYAAALVLQSLYQKTWGVFINWANWSAFSLAQEMADWADKILGGLFNFDTLINAAEELHDQESSFQDGGFPDSIVPDVQNILFCQSSVTDGIVTFDFDGVIADFAAQGGATPYPGLNFLLQLYIGEEGLNTAGAVNAGSGDCVEAPCYTWCHKFDFADGDGGFVPRFGFGTYADDRWNASDNVESGQAMRGIYLDKSFAATTITSVVYELELANGSGPYRVRGIDSNIGALTLFSSYVNGAQTLEWHGTAVMEWVRLVVRNSYFAYSGYTHVLSVTFTGEGVDPFGEPNC